MYLLASWGVQRVEEKEIVNWETLVFVVLMATITTTTRGKHLLHPALLGLADATAVSIIFQIQVQ